MSQCHSLNKNKKKFVSDMFLLFGSDVHTVMYHGACAIASIDSIIEIIYISSYVTLEKSLGGNTALIQ